MEHTFTMTHLLRTTLAINNDLGFNNARDAARAILNDPNWEERFKLSKEDAEFLSTWRTSVLTKVKKATQ